jgi:hypothetical protein
MPSAESKNARVVSISAASAATLRFMSVMAMQGPMYSEG